MVVIIILILAISLVDPGLANPNTMPFKVSDWGAYNAIVVDGNTYFTGYTEGFLKDRSEDETLSFNLASKVLYDQIIVKNIRIGDPLILGEGYRLELKAYDEVGDKAYVELSSDGEILESSVIQPNSMDVADRTFSYKTDIKESGTGNIVANEIVIIAVHFSGAGVIGGEQTLLVDGIWQISKSDLLDSAKYYEEMEKPASEIQVTSTPTGAEVILNGEYKGDTPYSISFIDPGSYDVVCALPGYIEEKQTVSVSSGATADVSFSLYPRPAPAGPVPLDISGKWKGIIDTDEVEMDLDQDGNKIDGTITLLKDKATFTSRGFINANKELELHLLITLSPINFDGFVSESDGKLHMEGTFRLIGTTEEGIFNADLTERATATISAGSEPAGADVLVDGVFKGKTPDDSILGHSGSHQITLRLSGYKDYNQTVTLVAGSTVTVSATLEPLTGSISLSSNPPGADVFVDGVAAGVVTPTLISGLSAGTHEVAFKLAGYSDFEIDATVVAGSESSISASLSPLGGASVKVAVEPTKVGPDENANITVTATGPDGSPLADADVQVNSSEGGQISIPSGKTDSQGRFSSGFIAPAPGEYRITATVKSPISGEAASDAAIEVATTGSVSPPGPVTPPTPVTPSTPEAKSTPGPGALAVLVILSTAGSVRARRKR